MPICAKQKPEYFEFASQQLDETFVHGPSCKCLASLASDGRIMAVVVFDHINDINCMMHVASDGSRRFITREFLAWTFRYPFMQLTLRRVTGLVRADNARALAFDRRSEERRVGNTCVSTCSFRWSAI